MTSNGILQIVLYFLVVCALTKPLGIYLARVYSGEKTFLHPVLHPLERCIYRLCGVREEEEQGWLNYAGSMLLFSIAGLLMTYGLERLQALPLIHRDLAPETVPGASTMTPDLAFNTAVSFSTNTNWQSYVPETTMSYFTQMVGLTTHNFISAAAGIAVALPWCEGLHGIWPIKSATSGSTWFAARFLFSFPYRS